MEQLREYIPFLIPIIIIELVLAITALVHVLKHPNYRFGNRVFWVLFVLFIQIIGPIIYFAFGREE
ncbi:MAG: PLD nuclease N-terminal domain-containing protein [Clostridiaceae bacterium]